MQVFDAIVIGVGGAGSAICQCLAARGCRVLGLEQFTPAHDRGSSHGRTRICRKAYFEHADYVPLLHRAYALWDELERASGRSLFVRCGLVIAGPPDSPIVRSVQHAAAIHNLAIDTMTGPEAERRFDALRFPADSLALYEPDAGLLRVEDCVQAQIDQAAAAGAVLQFGERVRTWRSDGRQVRVSTDRGEYAAARLALAAGAWSPALLGLPLPLAVQRRVQLWLRAADDSLHPERCPVYAYHVDGGFYYGFPIVDAGTVKVAEHTRPEPVADPDRLDRALHERDAQRLRSFATRHVRGVSGEIAGHSACMYTMTPDEHFVLDLHPQHANVAIAAGFSGHGFKFASMVGAVVADLLLDGRTDAPIGFLSARRASLQAAVQG